MAAVGSSRPASGCEHHASHFWDLLAGRGARPRALHGLQVGYATGFAMRLQRFAFGGGVALPRRPRPVAEPLDAAARAWLGDPPPDVIAAVAEKQRLIATVPASWPDEEARWAALRARLEPSLQSFDAVADALRRAGIPDLQPGYLGIDAAMLRAGLRYGARLRSRYTVVDFLEGQGVLERRSTPLCGDSAPQPLPAPVDVLAEQPVVDLRDAVELIWAQRRERGGGDVLAHLLDVARAGDHGADARAGRSPSAARTGRVSSRGRAAAPARAPRPAPCRMARRRTSRRRRTPRRGGCSCGGRRARTSSARRSARTADRTRAARAR